MAESVILEAEPRTAFRKANKALRRSGFIPLNIYGHGIDSIPLQAEESVLRHILQHATESSLFEVRMDGRTHNALIRNVQRHPVSGRIMHVDLYRVRMDTKTHVRLPLVFVGEAPAVKTAGGILQHLMDSLQVEGLPGDLPHNIEVDLSGLSDIDQAIHVKDIHVSEKLRILNDLEELVVKIQPPKLAAEEIAAEEVAPAAEAAPTAGEAPSAEAAAGGAA